MKRVTSRQRFVSWDVFDANAEASDNDCNYFPNPDVSVPNHKAKYKNKLNHHDEELSKDHETYHEELFSRLSSFDVKNNPDNNNDGMKSCEDHLKRKRRGSASKLSSSFRKSDNNWPKVTYNKLAFDSVSKVSSISPSTNNDGVYRSGLTSTKVAATTAILGMDRAEVSSSNTMDMFFKTIEDIPQDTLIYIFSFLDLQSWGTLVLTSKKYRSIFLESSDTMQALWMPYAIQKYKWDLALLHINVNGSNYKNKKSIAGCPPEVIPPLASEQAMENTLCSRPQDHLYFVVNGLRLATEERSTANCSASHNCSTTNNSNTHINLLVLWSIGQKQPREVDINEFYVKGSNLSFRDRMRLRTASIDSNSTNLESIMHMSSDDSNNTIHEQPHNLVPRPLTNHHLNRRHHQRFGYNRDRLPQVIDNDADEMDNSTSNENIQYSLSLAYFQVKYQNNTIDVVQFRGLVGVSDRCIRGNLPLSRPKQICPSYFREEKHFEARNQCSNDKSSIHFPCSMRATSKNNDRSSDSKSKHRPFLDFFCRRAKAVVNCVANPLGPATHWKPFVAPFRVESDPNKVHLTPRFVSYFEITIIDPEKLNKSTNTSELVTIMDHEQQHGIDNRERLLSQRRRRLDCIAVGVATRKFQMHTRMPGWDVLSYGYHGDDGGIFHNSGGMIRQFGPEFAQNHGDVIGCGIDYVQQGIFYTKNGQFLGYAWKDLSSKMLSQTDFYPVVGIDSNDLIHCNFDGVKDPFVFDFSSMLVKHEHLLKQIFSK